MKEQIVANDDDDIRLDRWFKRHMPKVTYVLLAKWTRNGLVRVDGKKVETGDRVTAGQTIRMPEITDTPEQSKVWATRDILTELEIAEAQAMVIYKDDDAIVLNKPPGLATQGGSGTTLHVDRLLDALCYERDDRPRLVHRLDKDTSGVLLLARSAKAAAFFSTHFKGRTATKVYWALVMGMPHLDGGLINAPLGKQPGTGGEKMAVDEKDGLSAKTEYRVIERAGNRTAWVEFQPLTGRTHQIRVHAATIGHAIVGDGKYGGKEAYLTGGVSRKMHLHARQLIIPHPKGGTLDICAELPLHMAESWNLLDFDIAAAPAYDPEILAATRADNERKRESAQRNRDAAREKPSGRRGPGRAGVRRRPSTRSG
jgi:23S rRNA pseudouridine955/2504/2580 synthase